MTQTGEENRRGMIRIRPYGAGFGQFDSAYKVGEGILFKAKIPFYFTHFTGQNLYWLAIRLTNRQPYSRMLTRDIQLNSATLRYLRVNSRDDASNNAAGNKNQTIDFQTNFMLLNADLHLTFVYIKILFPWTGYQPI